MTDIILPNVRKLFIPDKGYVIFDADLKGADGQVVAWESDDKEMKRWLRDGTDMHVIHCAETGGEPIILTLNPESYQYYKLRQSYKHATHGVHYIASAMALHKHGSIQWSIPKAEAYIRNYYKRHPGLRDWHDRIRFDLQSTRTIYNRFGYRIVYFDRIDTVLPQAVAWGPQSTVALTCFKGALQLQKAMPFVEILLQVHDSLVFQVPFRHAERYDDFRRYLSVEVPYPNDPLIIPWGLAKSEVSWGDCKKVEG